MDTITAFVTGADHPTGLGAARALRAAGARVIGFTLRPESATCRSRAWAEVRRVESPDPLATAGEVLEAARAEPGPVFLLPTQDDLVAEFSRVRGEFPENLRAALPPHAVVQTLLEKTRFAAWARERGYPLPRSEVAESRSELDGLLSGFRFPAILKPLVRTPSWQRASPVEKVLRLRGPEDLDEMPFDLFEVAPAYVLSEWIEGEDSDVLYCLAYLDEDSGIVASVTGRKLLQYPRLTGSTAICVGRPDYALEKLTADLFRSVGCQGLASLEVKRSAPDGRYWITEPTVGRPNLQSASAVAAGVNLHGIAMRHVWNRSFSDLLRSRRRCVWVEEEGLFEVLTTPTGLPVPYRLIAREILSARRVTGAHFRFSDPAPFGAMAKSWVRNGLGRLRPGG